MIKLARTHPHIWEMSSFYRFPHLLVVYLFPRTERVFAMLFIIAFDPIPFGAPFKSAWFPAPKNRALFPNAIGFYRLDSDTLGNTHFVRNRLPHTSRFRSHLPISPTLTFPLKNGRSARFARAFRPRLLETRHSRVLSARIDGFPHLDWADSSGYNDRQKQNPPSRGLVCRLSGEPEYPQPRPSR